jgi:hypothetical protein
VTCSGSLSSFRKRLSKVPVSASTKLTEVDRADRGEKVALTCHWSGNKSYFTPLSCSRKIGGLVEGSREQA